MSELQETGHSSGRVVGVTSRVRQLEAAGGGAVHAAGGATWWNWLMTFFLAWAFHTTSPLWRTLRGSRCSAVLSPSGVRTSIRA